MLATRQPGPVEEAPLPPTDAATTSACAALLAALPAEIDPGVERRDVVGAPDRVAAWGEPAVVLRCGVPEPERVTEAVQINRVDWSVRDSGGGFEWTTVGRPVAVSVELPDPYEENGFAELIIPLTGPITSTLPAPPPG